MAALASWDEVFASVEEAKVGLEPTDETRPTVDPPPTPKQTADPESWDDVGAAIKEVESGFDPEYLKELKAAEAVAQISVNAPPLGAAEWAIASKVPPEYQRAALERSAELFKKRGPMKDAGFIKRTAVAVAQGGVDMAMPVAEFLAPEELQLTGEQEAFRQALRSVREEKDPSLSQGWIAATIQQGARMGTPMLMMGATGRATGAIAKSAGLGAGGVKLAQGAGVTAAAYPMAADQSYRSLIAEGVDPGLAAGVSRVSGLFEGVVETIIPDPFKVQSGVLKGSIRRIVSEGARRLGVQAGRIGLEAGEEGAQAFTRESMYEVARAIDEEIPNQGLGKAFVAAAEEAIGSIGPLGVVMGPGMIASAVGTARNTAARPQQFQEAIERRDYEKFRRELAQSATPTEESPATDVNTRGEQPLAVQAVMQSFIDGAMQKLATLDKPPGAHKWAEIVLGDRTRYKEAPDEQTRNNLWQQSRGMPQDPASQPGATEKPGEVHLWSEGYSREQTAAMSQNEIMDALVKAGRINPKTGQVIPKPTQTLPPTLPQGATDVSQVPTNEEVQGQARIQGEQETRIQGSEQATQENARTEVPVEQPQEDERHRFATVPKGEGKTTLYRGLRSESKTSGIEFWTQDRQYAEKYGSEVLEEDLDPGAKILDLTDNVFDEDGWYDGAKLDEKLPGLADALGIDNETTIERERLWDAASSHDDDMPKLTSILKSNGFDGLKWFEDTGDQEAFLLIEKQKKQPKQVQGEIDDNQLRIFKDGKWRNATVTAVNEDDGWRVKHVKVADPETGKYENVPFPGDAAKGYDSYEQAREDVFSVLKEKYKEPPAISANPAKPESKLQGLKPPVTPAPQQTEATTWEDIGEGPFITRSFAEEFQNNEVSGKSRIRQTEDGWIIEAGKTQKEILDELDEDVADGLTPASSKPSVLEDAASQDYLTALREYERSSTDATAKQLTDTLSQLNRLQSKRDAKLTTLPKHIAERIAPTAAPSSPPKTPGTVYRGEGKNLKFTAIEGVEWWSSDPEIAAQYGEVKSQDISGAKSLTLIDANDSISEEGFDTLSNIAKKHGIKFSREDAQSTTGEEFFSDKSPNGKKLLKALKAEGYEYVHTSNIEGPATIRLSPPKGPEPTGEQDTGTDKTISGDLSTIVDKKPAEADGPTTTAEPTAEDEFTATVNAAFDERFGDKAAEEVEPTKPKKISGRKDQEAKPEKPTLTEKAASRKERTSATKAEKLAKFKDLLKQKNIIKAVYDPKAESKADMELLAATVELTEAAIDDGVSTFFEYVAWIADNIGAVATRTIAPYLETGWNRLGTYEKFKGKIDKAGKVADILPAAEVKAVEPREIGPLKKDEVRPRVEGQTWDEIGTGETSESIKEKVPGLEVDPLSIKGTHDLVEKIVFDVKEINSRRLAARKRRQRMEREKSPLFSDEIASQQEDPLEELKAIDAKNNQNREFYDEATRNHWMDQLKRLAELPADEQRRFVTFWNTASYPRSWANFAGSLSKWKSGAINTAKVVDRSDIDDPAIRARVEKLDKTWATLKDIERAAGDPKVARERLREEEAKYAELGFTPPAYESNEKTFAEKQAEKEAAKKAQDDELKKQILPGLLPDESKDGGKPSEDDVDKTLRQAGLKVEKLPDGTWQITGNTYEHSKEIGDVKREVSELGGWWDRGKKRWTFKRDPRRAISDRLVGKGAGEESGNATSRDEQVAREDARREQEARPDAQRPSEDYVANVDQSTKDLIARGLKYGMTQEVVDNQIEDIGMVVDAAENDRKMFVIGSAPGTGKTFVLGGVIRELRSRGFDKFIYVTQNQNLISQVQGNLADYGLEGVEFTTYTKSRSTPPSTTGAVLLLDEAHSAKNIDLATGKSVSSMVSGSRFTVYATATPFENVTEADYLASSGIFDGIHVEFERPSNRPGKPFRNTLDGFDAWAWMFGAKVYFVKNRNGDLVPVVWWDKHQTAEEDQFAANEWLKKRGVYVQRPMSLPAGTVNSELRGIDADPYWADISNEVVQIYADAESEAENNVERGQINAHKVNVLKRLLEAAKVDAAIARAKELIGEGKKDDPQVIIFVNTKVETNLGSFTLSEPYRKERGIKGDQAKRRYKPAEMDKMMQSWYEAKAAAKRMGEDAGPPPFAPFIHKIAMAMDRAGVLEKFPSVIDKIIEQFPGQAVEFSGRTPSKNAENLAKWKNNEAKLIVATMDKGGTGLSFHDTTGKMPSRYQVNMNLPWSGTKVEQVSGRLARYGTAKPVNLEWIFANNIPFDRELSRTVGSRMRSMSAAVQGRKSGEAKQIRDFDFEDLQPESKPDRLQQIQDTFPINREQAIVADILFDVTAIPGEVEIALPGTPIPGDALTQSEIPLTIARNLTPEELDGLRADVVKDIVAHFESLPPDTDFEEASKAGIAKRGWYKRAAESLSQLFGEDAERFVTLLAATSPRQGVTENLKMTLTIWKAWNEAGRPVSRREITKVLKPIPGALFGSRRPNTIRSLQGQRKLSGYKVNSFAQNLLGNFEEVTNDAWMAAFAGIDQKIFGTKAGYLAFSAKMRKTAKKLGMTPAEVQETIWSFVKTLSALRTGGRTSKEALAGMTHESVAAMPEFTELIVGNKDVKKLLGQLGLGRAVSRIAKEQAAITPEVSGPIGNDRPRVLGRIAGRIPSGAGGRGAPEAVARSKVGDTDTLYQDSALANGQPLFQQQRDQQGTIQAWTHFVSASKAIIGATDQADVSSFFHEFGHPMRRFLFNRNVPQEQRGNITDEDIRKIEDFVGVKDGKWTVENEERFVDALMSYWMEGKAPTKQLETIFQKISAWLSDVLSVIARKVDLTPEVRAIFDKVHQRGGVDPKKLQALSEAEVSKKSKVETAPKAAPDEAIDDSLDDFFGDIAPSEERVEALAKIKDAGIKIKQTAKGWSVTGLPNNLSWEMRDGIKAEGGRSTDYGYFFKDNPTSRLVGTAEEIIRESQLAAEAAEKGLVRTRIGDLEPAAAEWYENERAQRIGVLQATRSEAIQRVTDALVVSPKNRGMFAIKMKRAAENDYDSIVGFDEMAGLAGVSEQELFELLQKHKPASDREIEEQVDNELASLLYNASEQVEDDLSVEDGDISFDFGAPSEPAQPQQSAIEGLEDDVARLERKDIHKAKSDKFRNQLEGDSSKGKQSSFLSDIYGDKYDPTQGTLFDVDGIAENDTDTLFQAMESPERQAARILKSAIEAGATTFEDYIAHAREQLREDQLLQNASTMERTWDRLRARDGFTHLGPVGKVSDLLSEQREPNKPEPAKPEKTKNKAGKSKSPPPPDRTGPRVAGVRPPGNPYPDRQVEREPYTDHELTGMAKAVMNDLRELGGIPELEAAPPETIEQWARDAQATMAADPHAPTRLLNEIIANPARALDHHDVMLLAFRYRELTNQAEPHFQELVDANASGDSARIAKARTNYILARQPVTEFEELTLKAKSTWGRTGIALQVMLRKDNTVAGLLRRAREANHGKPLTPEQEMEMRDLAKRFAELQKKLDEETARADKAEAEVASLRHLKELVKESPTRKKPSKEQKSNLDKAWGDIAKLANVDVLFQRDATNPYHNTVAIYRELGVETFAELRRHVQERLGKEQAAKLEDQFKQAWEATKPETEVPANIDRGDLGSLTREARMIERSIVEGLMLDHSAESVLEMRDQIVDAVHAEMQELLDESFTRRQTMDALSGYGQFSRPSQDTTDTLLRNLNAEVLKLRQIDQLGDAIARTEQLRAAGKTDAEISDILINEGLLVAPTGLVRDIPTDTLRDLSRQYSELKKDIPASSEGRSGLLQTAIAAIERGLTNRIRDLNRAISNQESIKIGRKAAPTNENIERLKEERDTLLKEYRKLFPTEKKTLTPEQRLSNAIKAAERSIAVIETQLKSRDFDRSKAEALPDSPELTALKQRLQQLQAQRNAAKALELSAWEGEGGAIPPVKTQALSEAEKQQRRAEKAIETIQQQLKDLKDGKETEKSKRPDLLEPELRQQLDAWRDKLKAAKQAAKDAELSTWEGEGGTVAPDPKEAAYRKAYIASLNNRIAKLHQYLLEGDFSPQQKKTPRILSKRELELKTQLAELNTEKMHKMADYHLSHLKGVPWVADKISEVLHLARAIETSMDLSALGRQGGLIALGHPSLAKNALAGVIKSMAQSFDKSAAFNKQDFKWSELEQFLTGIDSREAELAFMHQLTEGEWGEYRQLAGLDLPSTDQAITRQEEVFQGRWGKLVPGVAISSRLYTMVLNKMRADMFDLMVEKLGRQGKPTLDEAKMIANFVNVMTGRSGAIMWQGRDVTAMLNLGFFAPRYVASRFQYIAMPFYLPFKGGLKANWQIKNAIYKEYARTASGAALTLGLIALAGQLFWDDDDENKPTVGVDPTTSDFLKPKFGETRLDFLAGLQQIFVLSARMLPEVMGGGRIGDRKFSENESGPYAQNRATVMARFLRTKLAPGPGYVVTGLNNWENVIGEKADSVFGFKVHPSIGTTAELFVPLSTRSIADTFETQSVPVAAGSSILSIVGVGMSTYGPKTEYMTGTPGEREEQIKKDLKEMEWDSPAHPPYAEFLTKEQLDKFISRKHERFGLKTYHATGNPETEDGIKIRDEAAAVIKSSAVTYEQAKKALFDYLEKPDKDGKKHSVHDEKNMLKDSVDKRLNELKKLFKDK